MGTVIPGMFRRKLPGASSLRALQNSISNFLKIIFSDSITAASFLFLALMLTLALAGPAITPHDPDETMYGDDGVMRLESPSVEHPLGTTALGYDVLSRIIQGARPTIVTGLLGGAMIITIGLSISLTAGYLGGWVDDLLMRFTDFIYGVPLIPFAIVLISLAGAGFIQSIVVIGAVLWRSSARVIRSQVLQIRERPFIKASQATGASSFRIVRKHILPNVAPMAIFYLAVGIGWSITVQASLVFLGITSPFVPSWGIILRNAWASGYAHTAWWWTLPPGLLISFTVLATIMFGRRYEEITSTEIGDDEVMVEGGGA